MSVHVAGAGNAAAVTRARIGHGNLVTLAMKERRWIWLVIANVVFIAFMTTLVVIAVRNKQADVPIIAAHQP